MSSGTAVVGAKVAGGQVVAHLENVLLQKQPVEPANSSLAEEERFAANATYRLSSTQSTIRFMNCIA